MLAGKDKITVIKHCGALTHCRTAHGSDNRLRKRIERIDDFLEFIKNLCVFRQLLFNIQACAEDIVVSAQNDAAYTRIIVEFKELSGQILAEFGIKSVSFFRAVDCNLRNLTFDRCNNWHFVSFRVPLILALLYKRRGLFSLIRDF